MEGACADVALGRMRQVEWQAMIGTLLERVDMKDLLNSISFDQLAERALRVPLPADHESTMPKAWSSGRQPTS